MKLYDAAWAPSPRRVRIYLAEKGIEIERVMVDLRADEQFSDAYLAINPRGAVPALELDDGEVSFVAETGIRLVSPEDLHEPDALVDAVVATGAQAVYLHIDLDVLDPGAIAGVHFPEPFGLSADELVAAIAALRARFELAGAAITEFAPRNPDAAADDLPVILRVLGALSKKVVHD